MSEYPTNPNYPDGTPMTRASLPDMSNYPKDSDAQEMKKICQLLHLGLCRTMDEMDKGFVNVRDALFRMKLLAQVGAHKIYPGHSLQELSAFDKKIRADLKHPMPRHEEKKRLALLQTRIDGQTKTQVEDQGGNVGPVVEPRQEEIENVQRVVQSIAPKIKIVEIEEKAR